MNVQKPIDITAIRERDARWREQHAGQSWPCCSAHASADDVPALLAEVEAQFSGEWVTEVRHHCGTAPPAYWRWRTYEADDVNDVCRETGCAVRRVWYGPVESVPTSDTTEATS